MTKRSAWRVMVRKLTPVGYRLMAKQHVPWDARKELLQDSIVVLRHNLGEENFRPSSKLSTYFYSVCNNMILAYFRSQKRNTGVLEEYRLIHHPGTLPFPLFREEEQRLPSGQEVWQAINALGERCYHLLLFFYQEDKTLEEIARALEYQNTTTVRQAKHQCLHQLRTRLNTSTV